MNKMKFTTKGFFVTLICLSLFVTVSVAQNITIFGSKQVGPQPDGSILVPSNQLIRPAGFQVYLPGRPVDLALSPGGKLLFVKNMSSLDLVRLHDRTILQSLPYRHSGASFTGICLSPDGHRVFVTNATDRICIAEIDNNLVMRWTDSVMLPKPAIGGPPVPGGVAMNKTGNTIYVTLSRNNSLAVVNVKDPGEITQIPVGIAPYSVIVASPSKAYVSNWGGRRPRGGQSAYNTSGSQVLVDPKTGIANNGSISVIDLNRNVEEKSIEVGLHPSGMVLSPSHDTLYVACANSDIISVIDTKTDRVINTLSVHFQKEVPFGSGPNALAVSPDGKYLYVANGTENALCVIQIENHEHILGYIPTGWYPGSVLINSSGTTLYVANVKGIGSRNQKTNRAGFNSHDHMGTISIIPVPSRHSLAEMTTIVHKNNSYQQMVDKLKPRSGGPRAKVPVPVSPNQTSVFKHVVYIIKENRTYDQVLGDMPQGNGDTSLVEFGKNISPNHHSLAASFLLMDNYNCSGVLSADGHQWTDEAYVTDYLEKSFGDFTRSYPYDGDDALAYASSGFIWDNVLEHGLTFRDYGEFVKTIIDPKNSTFSDIYKDLTSRNNKIRIDAKANLEQLDPYICPDYAGFTTTVPDASRVRAFLKEFKEYEKNNDLPNFIIMELPNDHTSGTKPGLPTPQAAMADNDLALGQIVDAVSHSKFWKETCIFVTEDDPQDGLDHVDGHRTVGFVISPYSKRGKVIATYYSQINMVRTIENILGLPPMNQLDLNADPMLDCFTNKPDYRPYNFLSNNIPLDQLNPHLNNLLGAQLYWARKSLQQNLDDADLIDDDVFNRIIWHAIKGYDRPYPAKTKNGSD